MKTLYTIHFALAELTKRLVLIGVFITAIFSANAQDLTLPLSTGNPIDIYIGSTICEPTSATVTSGSWLWGPIIFPVTPDLVSQNEATYHKMIAGQTTTVIVEVPYAGDLISNNQNGIPYAFGEVSNADVTTLTSLPFVWGPNGGMAFELPIKFERGTKNGFVSFKINDGSSNGGGVGFTGNWVVIPITVEGPTLNNQNVTIIDTIVEPQIPYLILHAPPGDQSSSVFQTGKTTCRKLQTNYAGEQSNAANLAVKLGIAGEAGLFVTTEFEFSVTLSAGLEIGDMSYEASAEETCVTINQGFETSSMLDDQGGGDVYIGYGTDLAMGIYEYRRIDPSSCASVLDTGLIYAPIGEVRQFAKTSTGIQSTISDLEEIVADSANLDIKTVNDAQNQIDVWNQVLELNLTNVNNPENEPIGKTFDLDGGTTLFRDENIQTIESKTIEYQHYTKVNLGLSAKVEVAGSGFEGGYEFKGSKQFGQSQNESTSESNLVKYTLSDDDLEDKFSIQVVRDPMYGTPIFRVDEGQSSSSCPYQVGYQRDQPKLTFDDDARELSLEDIPDGGVSEFKIKLCNDSNEDRTYHLKGNPSTNLNGAIIEGFGNNLFNVNDQGIPFDIPANSCLETATLTIKQANTNIKTYEGIELFLNVDCQEGASPIASSIFLNARFSPTTSLDDIEEDHIRMNVFPNPSQGVFDVTFEKLLEGGRIFLSDLTGKILYRENVQQGENRLRIEGQTLESGMYILHYSNDTNAISKNVIIH